MYSEISACPCHPLARITSHLLLRYNYATPHLNHPRGYFCGPAASALLSTLFLIVTLAATTLLFSNALTHTHIHFGRLLSLAFVIPSLERLTNLEELERETESEGELSDWIVSSIYTTFGSLQLSLSLLFPSLARERESTRSIYVPISRTGAF